MPHIHGRGALEAIIHVAIRRGIRIAHRVLGGGLSEGQKRDLDKLLDLRAGTNVTILAWARTPALSPTAINLDRIAEQLRGDGTTSSSDGQYFPAGGHAEAIGDLNAHQSINFPPAMVAEPRNAQERHRRPQEERDPEHHGRALFFDRLGELGDRTVESQFYRASGRNLLINAVVIGICSISKRISLSLTVKASPRRST